MSISISKSTFHLRDLDKKLLQMEYKEIVEGGQKIVMLIGVDMKTSERYVIFYSNELIDGGSFNQ